MTLRGELSKRPFQDERETKHFETVTMQMGRVQLESDWNEAFETLLRARRRALRDVIGEHGSPNDGFLTGLSLVLDHLESKDGWAFSGGADGWLVDYFEKVEEKGSFRVEGNGALSRALPPLLKNLAALRQVLLDRGAQSGTTKLLIRCKVSATQAATVKMSLARKDGTVTASPDFTVSCGQWQELEWSALPGDLSEYEQLSLQIASTGTVSLDRLALDPGLISDFGKDFYAQGGEGDPGTAGRYYVDGMACVKEGFETYRTQKDYPEPAAIEALSYPRLVYLDAWKRTITAVEDADIREVALGGPDTCAREQLVSQVKAVPGASCDADIRTLLRPKKAGTLTAKLSPKAEQDRCDFRPELDYTGLDNSLYRIEIHAAGGANAATFKWSRNNGADLVPITAFSGSDAVIVPDNRLLCCGDVVELCDDVSDLADFADNAQQGIIAVITAIDHDVADGVKITLDHAIAPSYSARVDGSGLPTRHPKLRKWHGIESVKDYLEFDPDGTPKKELEHGIRLAFSKDQFYHGDYWQFTARVNTRSIEQLDQAPPTGPVHHYAPLAVATSGEDVVSFQSCRNVFPPLTEIEACDIGFDADSCALFSDLGVENVQQAIEALCRMKGYDRIVLPGQSIQEAVDALGPEGGSIYLAPGVHIVTKTVLIGKRTNITISGDGSATRIVYIPEEPKQELETIEKLKAAIQEKSAAAKEEKDPEKKKEIENQAAELEHKMEHVLQGMIRDLFRIAGSTDVALRNFLMLSFAADSLVAVLDSKRTAVSACEIWNLSIPSRHGAKEPRIDSAAPLWNRVPTREGNALGACIRATDCCEVSVEENRNIGNVGILQQVGTDATKMPVINGMRLLRNRLFVLREAVILFEGTRTLVQDNIVQVIDTSLMALIEKAGNKVFEIIPGSDCFAESEHYIGVIVREILEIISRCVPDPLTACAALGGFFILRNSRIENNLFGGDEALVLGYSEGNLIAGNRIASDSCSFASAYSFSTHVCDNRMARMPAPGTPAGTIPKPIRDGAPGAASEAVPIAASASPMNTGMAGETATRDDSVGGRSTTLSAAEAAAVRIHFADRFTFSGNEIQGATGIAVAPIDIFRFAQYISKLAWIGTEMTKRGGAITAVKRFVTLMGLQPTIRLVEAVLKLFNAGQDLDLIAIFAGDGTGSWSQNKILKNLVTLFSSLFKELAAMTSVSRSAFSGNTFEVDRYGIKKIQDDENRLSLTLGGVGIYGSRITGAQETAILWKSCALLANPDLNGILLSCGYELLLDLLKTIRRFLKQLADPKNDFKDESSSDFSILLVAMTLYAVGQTCPEQGTAAGTEPDPGTAENPFGPVLQEIADAIGDLIDQLEGGNVRRNVSDLSTSVDRICTNRIRGKGTGIHTNIANCLIESNRIDLEPGSSAIAELFSIGRILATYGEVLDEKNGDHSAVAFLGLSLMSANPNAVATAKGQLSTKANQWIGIPTALQAIQDIVRAVPGDLNAAFSGLSDAVNANPPVDAAVKSASDAFLDACAGHYTGYGIIVEAPGAVITNNRVEALDACGFSSKQKRDAGEKALLTAVPEPLPGGAAREIAGSRQAPGGIIQTTGTGASDILLYLLLMDELSQTVNTGGQGTRISENSVQHGAGHGISLSLVAFVTDVRFEENEIQNHGLAGLLHMPAFSYKLSIRGNEINQCFLNEAFLESANRKKAVALQTMLGGLMAFNANEIDCSDNHIRACGSEETGWPAFGAAIFNCEQIGFRGNSIVENGLPIAGLSLQEEYRMQRGGVLLYESSGRVNISSNTILRNKGWALRVEQKKKSGASIVFTGNVVEVADGNLFVPFMIAYPSPGNAEYLKNNLSYINTSSQVQDLLFTSNQITVSAEKPEIAAAFHGKNIVFGNNQVSATNRPAKAVLVALKGTALGNMFDKTILADANGTIVDEHNVTF